MNASWMCKVLFFLTDMDKRGHLQITTQVILVICIHKNVVSWTNGVQALLASTESFPSSEISDLCAVVHHTKSVGFGLRSLFSFSPVLSHGCWDWATLHNLQIPRHTRPFYTSVLPYVLYPLARCPHAAVFWGTQHFTQIVLHSIKLLQKSFPKNSRNS